MQDEGEEVGRGVEGRSIVNRDRSLEGTQDERGIVFDPVAIISFAVMPVRRTHEM